MRDKDTECIIEKGETRRMYAIEPKKREKKLAAYRLKYVYNRVKCDKKNDIQWENKTSNDNDDDDDDNDEETNRNVVLGWQ